MDLNSVKTLQAAADSIAPGQAKVSVVTTSEPIFDPDLRKLHTGENRLAATLDCKACLKTGEFLDADKLPAPCVPCDGKGWTKGEDPRTDVDTIVVDLGHSVTVSIATLDGTGRMDRRRVRTLDELTAAVKLAVGQVAIEVAKPVGGVEMPEEEAAALLDLAVTAGAITPEHGKACKEARAARRRDAGQVAMTRSPIAEANEADRLARAAAELELVKRREDDHANEIKALELERRRLADEEADRDRKRAAAEKKEAERADIEAERIKVFYAKEAEQLQLEQARIQREQAQALLQREQVQREREQFELLSKLARDESVITAADVGKLELGDKP